MRLKIIQLNIWRGGKLLNNAISFLKQENPDIVNIQEAHMGTDKALDKRFRTVEILADILGSKYFYFFPAFLDLSINNGTENGNVIFSKFPIVSSSGQFIDVPHQKINTELITDFSTVPRVLQHAVIDIGKTKLNVFNIHGIWGTNDGDNERRLVMSRKIINAVKNKENVILSGDFNVGASTQTIHMIEEELKNVFKNELTTSFNMKIKSGGGFATSVVDHIFVSPDIKVIDHNCPDVDISDHLPLVAILDL